MMKMVSKKLLSLLTIFALAAMLLPGAAVTAKSNGLSVEPAAVDFGGLDIFYLQPEARTVTVQNTGSQTVTLNQPAAENYLIGALSDTELAPNETAVFTVQPKAGLAVDSYDEVLTISGTDGAVMSVSLSFSVEQAEHIIFFDANGGEVPYTSAVTKDNRLTEFPTPTRDGYAFIGWYTADGYHNDGYHVSTAVVFPLHTTLYAHWLYIGSGNSEQPAESQPDQSHMEWVYQNGGICLYIDGEMVTGWYQYEQTGNWYLFHQDMGTMVQDDWAKVDGVWYLFNQNGIMLTGWQEIGGEWYYLRSDGSMAGNAWVQSSGKWYYLTGSGEMATARWIEWKGDWYYLYSSGVMATDTTIDGYSINSAGVWVQ